MGDYSQTLGPEYFCIVFSLAHLYPLPPLPHTSCSLMSIVHLLARNVNVLPPPPPSPNFLPHFIHFKSIECNIHSRRRGEEKGRERRGVGLFTRVTISQATFLAILPSTSRHIEPSPHHDRGRSSISALSLSPILDLEPPVKLSIQSVQIGQTVSSSSTSGIILHHHHHHHLGDSPILPKGNRTWMDTGRSHRSRRPSSTLSTAGRIIATQIIVLMIQHLVVCSTRARTLLSATRKVAATVLSRGSGRGYVTLIAGLDVPDGADTTSLFIHWPVSWFTLRGLLISWGLVPTGLRCGGGGCTG